MFGLTTPAPVALRDFSACSGCSLCVLVCPMWRSSRDPRFSPEGLAKALQCGATAAELRAPLEACSLCGACDPVCPERIDLPGMIMDLRQEIEQEIRDRPQFQREEIEDRPQFHESRNRGLSPISASPISGSPSPVSVPVSAGAALLLPGAELRAAPDLLARAASLLGLAIAADDGADIALALETGVAIPRQRMQAFLGALRGHGIVAADGLLVRQLRRWLPGSQRMGLGTALSSRKAVRDQLRPSDLYVIEPRAYHADYERMVAHYNRLQLETGCSLSLDLQRIAVPATAPGVAQKLGLAVGNDPVHAKWILQGRKPARIIVESLADRMALQAVSDVPVLHVADLVQD